MLREQKGLSQISLAKQLNISNTTLSQYENNKRIPSLDILINISDILDVSVDEIIGREKDAIFYDDFKNIISDISNIITYLTKNINSNTLNNNSSNDDIRNILKNLEELCDEIKKIDEF
jgi:transcriptional regulator with XRE-family HTH domain